MPGRNKLSRGQMAASIILVVFLAVSAAGFLAWRFLPQQGRLSVVVDTGSLMIVDGGSVRPLPSGSVVVANLLMPVPGGLVESAAAVGAGGRLRLSIDAGRAVMAWLHSSRAAAVLRRGKYPVATLLLLAYTGRGEYMTAVALSPDKMLRMSGVRDPWRLLARSPGAALREAYVGRTLVLRGLRLTRVDIGAAIDRALNQTLRQLHYHGAFPRGREKLPQGIEASYVVSNPVLYSLRNSPPKEWYERILQDSHPAPSSIVKTLWNVYATHFSKTYYIPKTYTLSQVLRFAYLAPTSPNGRAGSSYYLVRTMTEFINNLAAYGASLPPGFTWRDASYNMPVKDVTIPILCASATYNSNDPNAQYVGAALSYTLSTTKVVENGLSLFGFITLGYSRNIKTGRPVYIPADVKISRPMACIYAPGSVGPGIMGDLVVTLVDVRDAGSYWVVKPAAVFMPSMYIAIDYKSAYSMTYSTVRDPVGSDGFLWAKDYFATVYDGQATSSGGPIYADASVSASAELSARSGSLVDLFFPGLSNYLNAIGLLGEAYGTYAELVGAAALGNPYVDLALFMVNLLGETVHWTVAQAYASQLELQVIVDMYAAPGHSTHVTIVKRTIELGYNTAAEPFRPILCQYSMSVGYPSTPSGPYHPASRGSAENR